MTAATIIAALFAVATILVFAVAMLFAAAVLVDEIRRLVERCDADEPVVATGLRLVPRDEVADRRALRDGGRVA